MSGQHQGRVTGQPLDEVTKGALQARLEELEHCMRAAAVHVDLCNRQSASEVMQRVHCLVHHLELHAVPGRKFLIQT